MFPMIHGGVAFKSDPDMPRFWHDWDDVTLIREKDEDDGWGFTPPPEDSYRADTYDSGLSDGWERFDEGGGSSDPYDWDSDAATEQENVEE